MDNGFLVGIAAWFFPGGGYLLQKRWKRGLIVGGVIWTMFVIAIASGGAYYPGFEYKDGQLLYLLNIFAKAGNGLGAIMSGFAGIDTPADAARMATFEYGGRLIEVAGLLNYLAIIDSLDVLSGRKE